MFTLPPVGLQSACLQVTCGQYIICFRFVDENLTTSDFHVMEQMGQNQRQHMFSLVLQVAASGMKAVISKYILLSSVTKHQAIFRQKYSLIWYNITFICL